MRSARLFLALWPDEGTRGGLTESRREWHWPDTAAPVARERLHLTVHFIGNVAVDRLPAVADGLQVAFEPFVLEFGCGEMWPHGVAVLRPLFVPEPLTRLHAALAGKLSALQLPVEARPYRPHVTLARHANGAKPPTSTSAMRWDVRQGYVLVHSLAGGRGYEVIRRYDAAS